MANASIGGIVSGLDTASIISQLMQLEAQPQSRLKSRVTTEQSAVNALQALNTKLAGLAIKAGDLSKMSAWTETTATSSSEHVTATTQPGAAAATLSFTVDALAARSQVGYTTTGTRSAVVAPVGTDFRIEYADGRPPVTVNTGDGSLDDIAASLNDEGTGLSAVLVRTGTDGAGEATYRLSVSSKETGAATGFSIVDPADPGNGAAFLGGAASTLAGRDAVITIEDQPGPLTSRTNTFEDLMPGLDVTLGAQATGSVTVTVAPDVTSLSDKVKAMVDAVNAAVTDVDTMTNYNATTKKAGVLASDIALRSVRDQLVSSVVGGVDGESLAAVGIQVDRYGKLTFDADTFSAAYAADPAGTADRFVAKTTDGGLASGLELLAKRFSNSTDGVVTSLVKGRTSTIDGLNDAIESWDSRLTLKRANLERQYGALEVALGKLQNQSSWLAGQIGSLPSYQQSG